MACGKLRREAFIGLVSRSSIWRSRICLQRGNSWIFGPEAPYERSGDVNDVVFPCGQTIGADGDTINLYYGAADSCIALATGSIRRLLSWLDSNGSQAERRTF
jgi:predicted GH43/DUF377 family glycosyl hydrolase